MTGSATNDEGGKPLSIPLFLLKHTQEIVTTATAIGILHLRSSHVLFYTAGALATSITAKGLKKVIKQPRPPSSMTKRSSGMPSTHSATMAYMGTYIFLCTLLLSMPIQHRIWLSLSSAIAPATVMWSRVRLGVHTPLQTLAGAALGVATAWVWFTLWNGLYTLSAATNGSRHDWIAVGLQATLGVYVDDWIFSLERNLLWR